MKVIKDENLSLQTQVETKNKILVMTQRIETQKVISKFTAILNVELTNPDICRL